MYTLDEVRRLLKPLNISEVSRQTGVHQNAIYRLMNNKSKPSYETVMKISEYLGTVYK